MMAHHDFAGLLGSSLLLVLVNPLSVSTPPTQLWFRARGSGDAACDSATRQRTLEKSVLIQFRFGFSFVNRGQYSDLGSFFRRTSTTARDVCNRFVSCLSACNTFILLERHSCLGQQVPARTSGMISS